MTSLPRYERSSELKDAKIERNKIWRGGERVGEVGWMKRRQLRKMVARLVSSCPRQVVTERVLGTPSSLPATHQCHLSIFTAHTVTHRTCLAACPTLDADGPEQCSAFVALLC